MTDLIQKRLNDLAGTTNLSNQDAINVLAGTSGRSQQDAFNIWAGTTGLSRQEAANVKAGTTGLSLQDALNAYSGGTSPETILGSALWAWHDASNTGSVTIDTGVSNWADLSGNSRPLTQGTAANQPTYTSGESVDFTSSNYRMGVTGTIGSTYDYYAVITSLSSQATWRTILWAASNQHPLMLQTGTNALGVFNTAFRDSGYNWDVSEKRIVILRVAANVTSISLDGSDFVTVPSGTMSTSSPAVVGNSSGGAQPCGSIHEQVLVDENSDGTTVNEMLDYLADKWSVTIPEIPARISGLSLWLKADSGTFQDSGASTPAVANNDPVYRWNDQSGAGNYLETNDNSKRPLLKTNSLNSLPTILFDGSNDFLRKSGIAGLTTPATVYMVYKNVTYTTSDYIFEGNSPGDGAVYVSSAGSETVTMNSGSDGPAGVFTTDTYRVATFIFNGASSVMQVDNLTETTGDPGGTNMNGFTLGSNALTTANSNIQVAEVIVYNTAHTGTQRSTIKSYLADRWGLTI